MKPITIDNFEPVKLPGDFLENMTASNPLMQFMEEQVPALEGIGRTWGMTLPDNVRLVITKCKDFEDARQRLEDIASKQLANYYTHQVHKAERDNVPCSALLVWQDDAGLKALAAVVALTDDGLQFAPDDGSGQH